MTSLRRAVVTAPLLLSLLGPAATLHPAEAAAPALAGTTVFTATRDAVATVRVPRAASLIIDAYAHSADVAITGTGRLTGFALTAVDHATREPATLLAVEGGMCAKRGCHAEAPRTPYEYVAATEDIPARKLTATTQQVTLRAGLYRVRSVTDGSPVRMTLRLAGLAGTTTVRVTTPNVLVLRTDVSPPGAAGVSPLRDVGSSYEFATDLGLMMFVILEEYAPHLRSVSGYCTYEGNTKPPTGRYHPGCPGAVYEFDSMVGAPTLHYYGATIGADIALVPGRWTHGYYSTGVGGTSSLAAVSLWMDLG